jgi:XTP/dITP diphosphohydrolase
MRKLFVATNNTSKLKELKSLLSAFHLLTPQDFDSYEPEESGNTYEENALIKARFWHQTTGLATIADDSGFNFVALQNWPGVHTADLVKKFGTYDSAKAHIHERLENKLDKGVFAISVIAYIDENGKEFLFEGRLDGLFTLPPRGKDGFAYDDIFQPNGYDQTVAELGVEWKKVYSHRALSMKYFLSAIES